MKLFIKKSDISESDIEVKKQEIRLENLINKYRTFVITFLIAIDYMVMYFLNRLDTFKWGEEIVGLLIIYGILYHIHRRTKLEKCRHLLKYITIVLDYLILLGCFYEGREILISETSITNPQYLLLITMLIMITNLFSILRIKTSLIIMSTAIAILVNYALYKYLHSSSIQIIYTTTLIALTGFYSKYVSTYIYKFFVTNHKLSLTLSELQFAHDEIQEQNHELEVQNNNLAEQRDQINHQKNQITNSITYASRIQSAVLDSTHEISKVVPASFILFKPKDIVSGDFYWFRNIKVAQKTYNVFTAVDCTGHGVPGAFMSMLGASLLNDITTEFSTNFNVAHVLNRLRDEVKKHLRQNGETKLVKDGMDMALCAINYDDMKLQYAGAHCPLYIIRNTNGTATKEIEEIKPDRMPIGVYIKEKESFTLHEIDIKQGDLIYLFSDGYIDQFGGTRGEKFKRSRFKELLLSIYQKPINEQKHILENTLNEWQGEKFDQIDDITVIGVQV